MSLARLVFTTLHWAEISCILEFLSIRDVWRLGCTNRSAFVTFLREKSLRKHYSLSQYKPLARFLSKYSNHHKVLLASYPRSGNSFVRQLLELETGIITGSDSRPNRTLASQLLQCGYRGEGITDNSVWVVKTHYPERLGYLRFYIARMILVVRNPFDAIESYFHMGLTNTHDKTLTTEAFESLRSIWTEFVENEASIWSRFHHYWIDRIERERIPALILRYEDLLEHRESSTRQMVQLMVDGRCPPGWRDGARRQERTGNDRPVAAAGYKPKRKVVGRGFSVMSELERAMVMKHCSSLMDSFGYFVKAVTPDSCEDVEKEGQQSPIEHRLVVGDMSSLFDTRLGRINDRDEIAETSVEVNDPQQDLRCQNDTFGRKIMLLRRSLTNDDATPLPTIS